MSSGIFGVVLTNHSGDLKAMKHPIWIVVAALVIVCAAAFLLPVVLIEPDDFDWYSGMISFSHGYFVASEQQVREVHEEMAEQLGYGEFHPPRARNRNGFIHERSPGYYGLLALL